MAQLLLLVLVVGLASQWLAWRIKLPAIVILIASGLILGPVTGVMQPASSPQELNGLIGLGVAIILFEGGMELKLGELRRTGAGVWRLALLGPPLAWLLGALAAHYVGGLGWPVAIVMAAILVVRSMALPSICLKHPKSGTCWSSRRTPTRALAIWWPRRYVSPNRSTLPRCRSTCT